MRWIALLAASAALLTAAVAGAEEDPKSKPKRVPPPAGIWWEQELKTGLARAAREGRPILFCVNALETESANQQLGLTTYRTAPWGQATRGYVPFVCNPEDHMTAGACSRYERHVCKGHQDALTWFLKQFGENLISPQHVILEPDGDVAWRKEYYTGVITPALLDGYLSAIAPQIAYSRAGIGREKPMKQLKSMGLETIDGFAKTWLAGSDGMAAAALVNVLDDCYDPPRRLALIAALRHTHDLQVPVMRLASEERVLYPSDEPTETAAWLKALFLADRKTGVWAATRVLVRTEDEGTRSAILRIWAAGDTTAEPGTATPGIADLPERERPFAYEALLLAGDKRARRASVPEDWTTGRTREIARARAKAGLTTNASQVDLAAALAAGRPGEMRAALLAASPALVRKHADAIVEGLAAWPAQRVRIAGALALLKTKDAHGAAVLGVLLPALADIVEGPSTHRALKAILGAATPRPNASAEAWRTALGAEMKGGGK